MECHATEWYSESAIIRADYLKLCQELSTPEFHQAFQKFIATREPLMEKLLKWLGGRQKDWRKTTKWWTVPEHRQ